MKCTNWSFAILCVPLAVLLSLSARTINARDADLASGTTLVADDTDDTAKQQCINKCRERYDNCLRMKQLSQFECQGIYQDCTQTVTNQAGAVIQRPLCE